MPFLPHYCVPSTQSGARIIIIIEYYILVMYHNLSFFPPFHISISLFFNTTANRPTYFIDVGHTHREGVYKADAINKEVE